MDIAQLNWKLKEILFLLEREYPKAETALQYNSHFELLLAVILSAQTTDRQVNTITKKLFQQVREPGDILALGLTALEQKLKGCGLYRQKSRQIMETCRILLEKYGGVVPAGREELEGLPGVGRKTASVVLNVAFGLPALAVDTHVLRVSNRLGLSDGKNNFAVEQDLCRLLPEEHWGLFHHRLIAHGRRFCQAKKPFCSTCPLSGCCRHYLGEKNNLVLKNPH